MANILGQITCNEVRLLEVDTDPASGLGTVAAIGSLAIVQSTGVTYKKFGSTDVQWTPTIFGEHYQTAVSLADSTNTSATTYVSKLTMTTPALPLGNYRFSFGFLYFHSTAGRQVQLSFLRNSTEVLNQILHSAATNARDFREGFLQLNSISGIQVFDMQFRTVGTGTASVNNASLSIWRTS